MPPVNSIQGKYWLLTIPHHQFMPYLPESVGYIKGQLEKGAEDGYLHWQVLCCLLKKGRLRTVKGIFGSGIHAELSRSEAATEYVWKEDTRVLNTQFELGKTPFKRNDKKDWNRIRDQAMGGQLAQILAEEAEVAVRHYAALQRIQKDFAPAKHRGQQIVNVYWGVSNSGKSHKAFEAAGENFYVKSPLTKWWDGYSGQENIILDEFRGVVDITHILKWLDKYPCYVETKGGQVPLHSKRWWITSNLSPLDWYPNLDEDTKDALKRRLGIVTHFNGPWAGIMNE